MKTANIQEIFCSFQGEAKYAGKPMIFIRFTDCNLRCTYCDTKRAYQPVRYCSYEQIPFSGKAKKIKNNLSVQQVMSAIKNIKTYTNIITFTGGEPLLQADFIKEFTKKLGRKYKYLLETNGSLPEQLRLVKDNIDIYSVDYKQGYEKELIEFCKLIKNKKKAYLKIVLTEDLENKQILTIIKKLGIQDIYLQPEYKQGISRKKQLLLLELLDNNKIAFNYSTQLHKVINIK